MGPAKALEGVAQQAVDAIRARTKDVKKMP